ncbi:NAD(P)/FAD-dependent oxidoreductase [Streptomyces sp. JJ36]|uniref:FAD-dependent oxidoreductase n=1 Tax=Streptomyces sp. JJ36 TaxID=2736645 RepID=UPI001F28A7C7|nr:NAD(P)-binding protein [Streptomyces sp. JJ36]MCF6524346.1 NAD(P)-binding protein [Streptomyces sp. JJ36]
MTGPGTERAVVLGAGVAGLLAARVLAETHDEVLVVERDPDPGTGVQRRGVPQGRHIHGLLAAGQRVLDALFPGLTRELAARGAAVGDLQADVRWFMGERPLRRAASGLTAVGVGRPLLERVIRDRVAGLPAVRLLPGRDIAALTATRDGSRVTGVRVLARRPGRGHGAEEYLAAGLVVDATGRGSRTPAWLAELGYPRPPEDRVRIGLVYASRSYRLRRGALGGDLAVLLPPVPGAPRGGAVARVEDGRALVTLSGVLGEAPPTDPEGFHAFARSLRSPDIERALEDAEPLGDPVPHRFPASLRRRYERLPRLPEGLLALGDSVCSFNPVYGQGMSVAALEAEALRRLLARGAPPAPRTWFRTVARAVDVPWELAAGADRAFPGVPGERTRRDRLLHAYVTRLQAAAAHDARLGGAFLRVTGLVAPPWTLLHPAVAVRVLRGAPA